MLITIHFFRKRNLERMDYEKLINYFEELGNCRITSDDDCVEIIYNDAVFGFPYRFLITKRSRVRSVYSLSGDYFNINLLVEIPVLLPAFVSRNILKFILELCQLFELDLYYDGVKDIVPFDMVSMLSYLAHTKEEYLTSNPDQKVYYMEREKLNQICNFQQMKPYLPEKIKAETLMNPYIVMVDSNNQVVLSVLWNAGCSMIFPPYLDYVHIEEDGVLVIVPATIFMKYVGRYMTELKDYIPNLRLQMLQPKSALRAKKHLRKVRKETVPQNSFETIRLIDLVEK